MKISLSLAVAILLASCAGKFSLQKRKYTKGFYFAHSQHPPSKKDANNFVVEKAAVVAKNEKHKTVLILPGLSGKSNLLLTSTAGNAQNNTVKTRKHNSAIAKAHKAPMELTWCQPAKLKKQTGQVFRTEQMQNSIAKTAIKAVLIYLGIAFVVGGLFLVIIGMASPYGGIALIFGIILFLIGLALLGAGLKM